ncbi:MAG: ATP-binding cassette domain-containing protein, partial [Gammaproteobacteria bacterium]
MAADAATHRAPGPGRAGIDQDGERGEREKIMSTLVKARGLSKHYGNLAALNSVDFDSEEGCIVGLIGPNGAGKTTALKAVLG